MTEAIIPNKLLPCCVIKQQNIDGEKLTLKESDDYRWFEYAGTSMQSIMSLSHPAQIIMPVTHSFLLFLLIKPSALNILNLGLGGGAIERCLAQYSALSVTSIEASPAIIEMAKRYFLLPKQANVICAKAEDYIEACGQQYDVVLSDLFVGEQNADCLFEEGFYRQLAHIMNHRGLVLINLYVTSEKVLIEVMLIIKKYFPFVALIEFKAFSNLVLIASSVEISCQQQLKENKRGLMESDKLGIDDIINNITYIPNF